MAHPKSPLNTTPSTWRKDLDPLSVAVFRAFINSPTIRGRKARAVAEKAGFSPYSGEKVLRRVRATFGLTPKRATGVLEVTDRDRWNEWKHLLTGRDMLEIDPPEEKPFELPPAPEAPAPAPSVVVDDKIALVEHDGKTYEAPIPEEAEGAGFEEVPKHLRNSIRYLQAMLAEHGVQSVTVTPDDAEIVKVEVKVTARKFKI